MSEIITINLPDAEVELHKDYFDKDRANFYFEYLSSDDNIHWKQETMNMYGRELKYARLMAWYGEEGKEYRFSGKTQKPNDWNSEPILKEMLDEIQGEKGETFNSALLNHYRNGRDSISWHSDNEKELGELPCIYSISLGQERVFRMRRFDRQSFVDPFSLEGSQLTLLDTLDSKPEMIKSVKIPLPHNSLLIMKGTTQKFWQHAIDKVDDPKIKSRINLTFRTIINK